MYMNERKKFDNTDRKSLPKKSTILKTYAEIKVIDPDTNLSVRVFRKLDNNSDIPTMKISNTILNYFDSLLDLLSCGCYNENATCV